jgi:proteasome lid subunit RPN8/RPN11
MRWTDTSPKIEWPLLTEHLSQHFAHEHNSQDTKNVRSLPTLAVTKSVRAQVMSHLQTSAFELGGLLIGTVGRINSTTSLQRFEVVIVSHSVAAEFSESTSVSLRMPAHVWSAANQVILAEQTTALPLRVVGWYHSHPNLGAFFSQTDRHTQASFFNHDYNLGWVIDPVDGDEAWFIGSNCKEIKPIDQA